MAQVKSPAEPAPTNAASRRVGELGDPERLVFEGLHTFSPRAVRLGLLDSMDFLMDSHPLAPLDDYLQSLRNHLRAGYQNAGFPDVQISASLDSISDSILVKVNEGPRCLQAEIKVMEAGTIPVELLVRRLTEAPSAQPANPSIYERLQAYQQNTSQDFHSAACACGVWEPGKPASFDESSLNGLTQRIDDILKDLGFFFVRTQLKMLPDTRKGTADLLIDVLDEGSSGVLDQINFTGLKRNRSSDLVQCLGLKPGQPVNRELLRRTEDLLWRSARFRAFEVTPEAGRDRRHIDLRIALTEFEPLPPLHQELSREAKALLRFCDWLSDQPTPGRDIVLTMRTSEKPLPVPGLSNVQLIMAQGGLLVTAGDGTANENMPVSYAAVLAQDMIGLFDLAYHAKLVFAVTNPAVEFQTSMTILPNPDPASDQPFSFAFGASLQNQDNETNPAGPNARPTFKMQRFLAPMVFAALAYTNKQDVHFSFNQGLMTLSGKDFRLTTEEKSGKLAGRRGMEATNGAQASIYSESQAFDKALAQIIRASATDRNVADPKTKINSTLAFLLKEALRVELLRPSLPTDPPLETRRRAAAALEKILEHGVFAPLDVMVAGKLLPEESNSFDIPHPYGSSDQGANKILAVVGPVVFRYGDDLAPHGSWPWLLLREAAFILGNKARYSEAVLQQIYESDQTGPFGFEAIARLLGGSPARVPFANRGLTRLSAADFRNDCKLLLDQNCALGQCFDRVAQGLAALDDAEVEALANRLSPEYAAFLRRSVQSLRQPSGHSLAETLSPALNDLWDKRLKQMIETDLIRLAKSPAAGAPPGPAQGK